MYRQWNAQNQQRNRTGDNRGVKQLETIEQGKKNPQFNFKILCQETKKPNKKK